MHLHTEENQPNNETSSAPCTSGQAEESAKTAGKQLIVEEEQTAAQPAAQAAAKRAEKLKQEAKKQQI